MKELPKTLKRELVASSNIFKIEQVQLQFSNGTERIYERLLSRNLGAVLIVPFIDAETILLVREYCGGTERYELGFPKGLMNKNEDIKEAANRELMEEIGYGAKQLLLLKYVTAAPGYWNSSVAVILAKDLYPQQLPGDEPEPLDIIPWKISDYRSLLQRDDFTEARSIAALLMVVAP